MIHPREASLGEEARTSLETEGSTREAGNPRLKLKSARNSLGPSSLLISYPPIVGCLTVYPIKSGARSIGYDFQLMSVIVFGHLISRFKGLGVTVYLVT